MVKGAAGPFNWPELRRHGHRDRQLAIVPRPNANVFGALLPEHILRKAPQHRQCRFKSPKTDTTAAPRRFALECIKRQPRVKDCQIGRYGDCQENWAVPRLSSARRYKVAVVPSVKRVSAPAADRMSTQCKEDDKDRGDLFMQPPWQHALLEFETLWLL